MIDSNNHALNADVAAAFKAGFELSDKVAWLGGWKEAYSRWAGNGPSRMQHMDAGVTPSPQDKIREKTEANDGRHGPSAAVSRQHPDKASPAGRDHRHPKAGERQGETCGGEAGDTGVTAEGTRQGLRSTGAVGQRNLDAPVSHSMGGDGISELVTDETFDLVRSMGAIADGCDSESVMEALGALTIALIVGGAEDRAHAQGMAEKFAENIVECVDDALDQQEGRP